MPTSRTGPRPHTAWRPFASWRSPRMVVASESDGCPGDLFRALKLGDASLVALVDKLSLVLVAVFAFAFLAERPSPQAWLGIGLVAVGVVVLGLA